MLMQKLIDFLNRLESANISYTLVKTNDEYIMVNVCVPGERWEVEFSDADIRVEIFRSDGFILNESAIKTLFVYFDQ